MEYKANQKKNPLSKSINPFKGEFLSSSNIQYEPLGQTFDNINNNEFHNNVIGNPEGANETIFQLKINKQPNARKRNSQFYTKDDFTKPEFRESIKDTKFYPIKKDDFLVLRRMPTISQQDYEIMKNNIIDSNTLIKLYNYLQTVNCNFKSEICRDSIGGISPLTYLIESSFSPFAEMAKEIYDKYNILKPYIYNFRTINGDGNCFYRAVMFRYLEILILNNQIEYLQNVIYDIVNAFNTEELKARKIIKNMDITPDLTFKILILIVDLLKNKMMSEAHQILVKSFSTAKKFDYAMILYFRYVLYDYIKKNENKGYLKDFPIQIGNLLPSKYETEEGKFLFNDFYEKYLLNFFTDAEKIIIYLTPFVLGVELDVIVFDDNEDEIIKKLKWEGNSELQIDDVISLINKKNHYEIIYTSKDYEKNKSIFQIYENKKPPIILGDIEKNNLYKKDVNINDSNYNILSDSYKDIKKNLEKNNEKIVYKKKSVNSNDNVNKNTNKIQNNKNPQNNIDYIQNNNANNIENNYNNQNNKINPNNNNIENNYNNNIRNHNNNYEDNNRQNINDNNPIYNKANNHPSNPKSNYSNNINNNFNNNNNDIHKSLNLNQDNNNNYFYNNNNEKIGSARLNPKTDKNLFRSQIIPNENSNIKIKPRELNQINEHNYIDNKIDNNNNNPNEEIQKQNNVQCVRKNKFEFKTIKSNSSNIPALKNTTVGFKTPGQDSHQSNIPSKNKDLNIPEKKGFITPGQDMNQNKCMNCSNNIDNNNIELCKSCFKLKIIEEFYTSYLLFIEGRIFNLLKVNITIKLKKNEEPKNLELKEALNIYNKYYNNENLDLKGIIKELKEKICIFCKEDIKKEKITLPCMCNTCSKEDLNAYIDTIDFNKDYICNCSTKYTREMIFSLGVLSNIYENNYKKNRIINFFNQKLKNICFICGKTSNVNRYTTKIISSKDHSQSQSNINNFLSKLIHYYCDDCYKMNFDKPIFCQICNTIHYFIDGYICMNNYNK